MNDISGQKNSVPMMADGHYLEDARDRQIIRASLIGIVINIILASFKLVIGRLSGAIAITLDAVNNLTDSLSSIITIIATKLSLKPADHRHPYGYGRIEYLSSTVISAIVLYAGITSLIESIEKILHPEVPSYSAAAFIVLAVGIAVKIFLYRYVKGTARKTENKALKASAEEARFDIFLSSSVLLAAAFMLLTGLDVEAFIGVVIALLILKSGIELLKEAVDDLLGARIPAELSRAVKQTICTHENALGAYDLFLHSYGPSRMEGSVHIEVPDYLNAVQIDSLIHEVVEDVYKKHSIVLTGVSIYSHNTKNNEAAAIREEIQEMLRDYPDVTEMHGCYLDEAKKSIRFDIVISFSNRKAGRKKSDADRHKEYEEILQRTKEKYPQYSIRVNLDSDVSD